ncbi:hypothetical protein SAMN05216519_1307 [Delftia acidovorans]|nr:hypothetical protein SAMN05216519_1307 [Delftia acidovorans]
MLSRQGFKILILMLQWEKTQILNQLVILTDLPFRS